MFIVVFEGGRGMLEFRRRCRRGKNFLNSCFIFVKYLLYVYL